MPARLFSEAEGLDQRCLAFFLIRFFLFLLAARMLSTRLG